MCLVHQVCCCAILSTSTTWRSLKKKPSSRGKKTSPKNSLEKEKLCSRYQDASPRRVESHLWDRLCARATRLTSPVYLSTSPHLSGQPVAHLAGDGGGGGVGRRRRLRRRPPRWIDHIWISLSPLFLFLLVVGFLFSLHPLIIRKSALDLTTSGAARGCISLRK